MGKSADFSEGIKLIREAHADAVAILAKWRELIEAPGEVTLNLRDAEGVEYTVTMPSIREAINRYLGSIFSQLTLTDENDSVIIRMNDRGEIEMVQPDETRANLIAGYVAASRLEGVNGTLPISGRVALWDGSIQNASIKSLDANESRIVNATLTGTTTISGTTRIQGSLTVKSATMNTLNMGKIEYRKQVVKFGVKGLRTSALDASTNGDIWTGDVSVLEAAGIYSEPTWSDCTYTPESIITALNGNTIHIYWDTPEYGGDLKLMGPTSSYDFIPNVVATWPYKMYEKVDGGYRIRWLPLNDQIGRIHYARTGNSGGTGIVPIRIEDVSATTGREVYVQTQLALKTYQCSRFMAEVEQEVNPGASVTHNLLYKL